MNLLIVDDSPTNLRLLRAQLESEGHEVREATNGVEALALLEHGGTDAIISDILMPNMDGFRLCHEIRKHERLGAMPLILYTSTYNSPSDRELAKTVGADCYLLKPAPTLAIVAAIAEAYGKSADRSQRLAAVDESYVLKQYNTALVRKLEETNAELQQTLAALTQAHEQILELNRDLEARVAERTAALDVANRNLEAFSYSVAHDLRAPLRHICGFACRVNASASERLTNEEQRLLDRVSTSAGELSSLIDHLLEFSRVGKVAVRIESVDLNMLVEATIAGLAPEAGDRSIEWVTQVLPTVSGDAALLGVVFSNLLGNAIKYTRTRALARIEIGVEHEAEHGRCVLFVRDNGVGFDMRYVARLFGVFQRLHSVREFEGTGIGLASAQRIIARHGGRIWAESELGQGAVFRFTLS